MKQVVLAGFLALGASFSAHAEGDVEAVYQSLIPKASACYSAKLESQAAAICQASCDEAVGNLRLLVMGAPQPLSDLMKGQVAKCEADYAAFAGPSDEKAVPETTIQKTEAQNTEAQKAVAPKAVAQEPKASAKPVGVDLETSNGPVRQEKNGPYAALQDELSGLSKACSSATPSRHSKNCVKFCDQAASDLGKIGTGDANIDQALKNARGDVEKLASLRQCRLRHKMAFR